MLRHSVLRAFCLPALTLGALALLQGCNTMGGQPEMVDARITPDALKPGDEALITVQLKDKNNVVSGIEGVVQEDQRITFDLNDRGEQSDQKPGDGVWSFGVKVPFQAPEGQFLLELTAYREDGNPVSIRQKEGGVTALQRTVPLVISAGGATTPAPESIEAPSANAVEAAPGSEAQVGESPSEAGEAAEPSAEAAPERNPKSVMGGGAAQDDGDEEEAPRERRKKRDKKQETQEVEEARPVQDAAPGDDAASGTE